jgi:hypothetical protein
MQINNVAREVGWLGWRVVLSGLEKKHPKNNNCQRSVAQKGGLWYNVRLTKGQEPDEEMHPILWTERPTGALVGAGSLWPHCGCWFGHGLMQWQVTAILTGYIFHFSFPCEGHIFPLAFLLTGIMVFWFIKQLEKICNESKEPFTSINFPPRNWVGYYAYL